MRQCRAKTPLSTAGARSPQHWPRAAPLLATLIFPGPRSGRVPFPTGALTPLCLWKRALVLLSDLQNPASVACPCRIFPNDPLPNPSLNQHFPRLCLFPKVPLAGNPSAPSLPFPPPKSCHSPNTARSLSSIKAFPTPTGGSDLSLPGLSSPSVSYLPQGSPQIRSFTIIIWGTGSFPCWLTGCFMRRTRSWPSLCSQIRRWRQHWQERGLWNTTDLDLKPTSSTYVFQKLGGLLYLSELISISAKQEYERLNHCSSLVKIKWPCQAGRIHFMTVFSYHSPLASPLSLPVQYVFSKCSFCPSPRPCVSLDVKGRPSVLS